MVRHLSRHWSRRLPRCLALAALAFLAVACLALPCMAPPCMAVEPGETLTQDFGDFQLTVACERLDEYVTVFEAELSYKGSFVFAEDSYHTDPSHVERLTDFPAQGLTTVAIHTYSGGAHCCFLSVLLTLGPDRDQAMTLTPSGDTLVYEDVNSDGIMEIPAYDMAFDYYYLDDDHNLCHACSPYFRRWLVFDTKGWRPDQRGEFPQAYAAVLESLPADSSDPAQLLMRAYAVLMAGGSDEDARAELDAMPEDWQSVTDRVFADLRYAVDTYNPLERINLP